MTLTQLEYIIAIDTYRSFVAAAEKCFVTQPTLSMQVQKLEETLGVKLFDRSQQPVIPTEIGEEILKQARMVIQESRKITEIISDRNEELEGELRIGVIPTLAPYLLPKVLGGFLKKHPKFTLKIWEYTTNTIIEEITKGHLDCGILSTPLNVPKMKEHFLFYETFVSYIAKNSLLQQKKLVTASDVLEEKLWLLNEGHCMRNQVLNICSRKKLLHEKDIFEYNTGSIETLKRMVEGNDGATVMPELSISDFTDEEMEDVRYFKEPEPVREISLVTKENYLKKKAIQFLKEEILDVLPKRIKKNKKKIEIMEIN